MSQWWSEDVDVGAQADVPTPPQATPPQPPLAAPPQATAAAPGPTLLARSGTNSLIIGAFSGLASGAVGLAVGSLLSTSSSSAPGVVVGFVAGTLGFLLNGWGDLSAGYVERGLRNGIIGILVAVGGGMVGLVIADALYFGMGAGGLDQTAARIALVAGWLAIGTLIGLGIGALQGIQKASAGLLGGAIGGLLGGVLFVALDGSRSVDTAMLVGTLVAATILGTSVGTVERLMRSAWVTVLDGPLAGREFILYGDRATVGSDASCDVALPGDASIWPVHLTLSISDEIRAEVAGDASASIAGQPVLSAVLTPGSVLQLGSTFLEVHRS